MRLICDQKNLAFALNVVNKAVSVNNTLPVLNNIYLKASGKKLYFHATNLEIALACFIDADVINEGEITLPAKILTNYINFLTDKKVELKLYSSNKVELISETSNTKINGLSPEDFPSLPNLEKEGEFLLESRLFKKAIEQTVFATSFNLARPILSGVLFDINGNILKLAATDSYRLAEKTIYLDKDFSIKKSYVLPGHSMLELSKILFDSDEKVKIILSKNQVLFEFGNIQFFSRIVEGAFPDYNKVIPRSHRTLIEVPIKDLTLATKRINVLVGDLNNNIKISVTNDGKMRLSTGETYLGEGDAELNVKITGTNNKISVNGQYLLDVLQVLDGDTAVFELNSKMSPSLIKPKGDNTDYKHIIMPLKP